MRRARIRATRQNSQVLRGNCALSRNVSRAMARTVARRVCGTAGFALCCAALAAAGGAAPETVTYTLTPDPKTGGLEIELIWQTAGRSGSRLCISEHWGAVADVPALVKNLQFDGAQEVRRDRACWDLTHRSGAEIHCKYTVSPGRRTLDWDGVHLPIATAKFLPRRRLDLPDYADGRRLAAGRIRVRAALAPTQGLAGGVCSWGVGKGAGGEAVAGRFPAVGLPGRAVDDQTRGRARCERAGRRHAAGIQQQPRGVHGPLARDHRRAVRGHGGARLPAVHGHRHPGRQAGEGSEAALGAPACYRSFAMFVPPDEKLGGKPEVQQEVEHLFAHELFHHWNGQLIKPADPQALVSWFIEGLHGLLRPANPVRVRPLERADVRQVDQPPHPAVPREPGPQRDERDDRGRILEAARHGGRDAVPARPAARAALAPRGAGPRR